MVNVALLHNVWKRQCTVAWLWLLNIVGVTCQIRYIVRRRQNTTAVSECVLVPEAWEHCISEITSTTIKSFYSKGIKKPFGICVQSTKIKYMIGIGTTFLYVVSKSWEHSQFFKNFILLFDFIRYIKGHKKHTTHHETIYVYIIFVYVYILYIK